MDTVASAILLAAGRSRRMGGATPKPLLEVAGVPVVARSAAALLGAPSVGSLVVVTRPDDRAAVRAALGSNADRVVAWVDGGEERTDSVRAGAAAAPADADVLLVHDAARCLVRSARVEEVVRAAREHGAAVLAAPTRDTIKRSTDGGTTRETLDRAELWSAQTPQAMRADDLRACLARAAEDGFRPTDDVALYERYVGPVRLVRGDDDNLKLTTPADLAVLEALARAREVTA